MRTSRRTRRCRVQETRRSKCIGGFEVGVRVLYTVRVFCVCFSYFRLAVQMLRCVVQYSAVEQSSGKCVNGH